MTAFEQNNQRQEIDDLNYQLMLIQQQNAQEFIRQLENVHYSNDKNVLQFGGDHSSCCICIENFREH